MYHRSFWCSVRSPYNLLFGLCLKLLATSSECFQRLLLLTEVCMQCQSDSECRVWHCCLPITSATFCSLMFWFFFQMWLATDHYSFCCRNEMQIKFWNRNKRWFLKKVKITSLQSTLQWDLLWLQIKCSTLCTAAPLWVSV